MRATLPLIALSAALALSACSKNAQEPDPSLATSSPADTTETGSAAATADTAPEPVATSAATPTPAASQAVAATEIPAALRGRWGLVPKDCTSKLGDAKGLLTVSAAQLKFYESVAKLGKIKEADDSRIRATFTYSGEGQTWTQDVVLDARDGGKTLIRRDYGKDALPSPLTYTRCT